jgi:hypothetical protein
MQADDFNPSAAAVCLSTANAAQNIAAEAAAAAAAFAAEQAQQGTGADVLGFAVRSTGRCSRSQFGC